MAPPNANLGLSQAELLVSSVSTNIDLSPGEQVLSGLEKFRQHTRLPSPRSDVLKISSSDVEIEDHMGHCGYQSYYKVTLLASQATNETFCLKRIDSHTRSDELAYIVCAKKAALEAEILSRLSHPNIVRLVAIHGTNTVESFDKQRNFIVIEYFRDTLDGQLDDWMQQSKKPAKYLSKRMQQVASGIIDGMSYLHKNNIIHRNIKPSSVGVTHDGNVKITDFSIAKDIHVVHCLGDKMDTCGSPRYMAPEVCANKWYSLPIDVYSFGILLWEVSTLQRPFYTLVKPEKIHSAVIQGERPSVRRIEPASLRNLIVACWHPEADQRPTFDAIREQMDIVLNDLTTAANNPPPAPTSKSPFMRFRSRKKLK